MRRIKITTIFFLSFFSNKLFAQYEAVFKTPYPLQYHVLDSIINKISYLDTSSIHSILRQLERAAQASNNEQNLLNFKRSVLQYRYISSQSTKDTAILNQFTRDATELLEQVDENKYPEISAMINTSIGNTGYYKTHEYPLAFKHFIKAYNLFKKIPGEKFPDKQYSQYAIALAYYQFNDYKNGLKLGKEIESLYPIKNYTSVFTIDMIGMCYLRMQQYDSAISNFQWILDNLQYALNSKAWEGIAAGNIGDAYFLQGQYDKALAYLEQGVNLTVEENLPDNAANFAAWTTIIYLKQQNLPIAKKYLEIAQQAAWKSRSALNYYNVYKAQAEFYKQTGDNKLALLYIDSSIIFKDSLAKINDVNLRYQSEIAVEAERKNQQEQTLKEERSRQILTRNGLILFIALGTIIILLLRYLWVYRKANRSGL